MITEPVLPLEVPTGWMVVQKDQHRYLPQMTPGISGKQSTQEWLKLAVVRFVSTIENSPRLMLVQIAPPPNSITWIQERLSLYDKVAA